MSSAVELVKWRMVPCASLVGVSCEIQEPIPPACEVCWCNTVSLLSSCHKFLSFHAFRIAVHVEIPAREVTSTANITIIRAEATCMMDWVIVDQLTQLRQQRVHAPRPSFASPRGTLGRSRSWLDRRDRVGRVRRLRGLVQFRVFC